VTPHRVPYIQDRTIVVVPTSKTVTNAEDLDFFYSRIRDIPNCVMLDIGANKGYYSLLTTLKPDLRYFAFEPQPRVYRNFLLRNLAFNQVEKRGQAFNYGLADRNFFAPLWFDNSENASLQKDAARESEIVHEVCRNPKRSGFLRYSSIRCEFRRLDDVLCTAIGLWRNSINAIKLDVEGAESLVIDGGTDFFQHTDAFLFVEVEERHCARFNTTVDSVIEKLRAVGYSKFEQVRNNYLCTKTALTNPAATSLSASAPLSGVTP